MQNLPRTATFNFSEDEVRDILADHISQCLNLTISDPKIFFGTDGDDNEIYLDEICIQGSVDVNPFRVC
jgi:hypothetical protein